MRDPGPTVDDERALVRRAVDGDHDAYARLVELHRGPVFRFARRLAGDDSTAEDVLQETFLAAYRRLSTFRGEGSVRTWLLSIARNAALTTRRRRVGEPASYEPADTLMDLGLEAGWGQPSPEDRLVGLQSAVELDGALATIPEPEREVLLLRDVEGLSGEETAAVLDLTLAAMKSRLHRARLKLVAALRRGDP